MAKKYFKIMEVYIPNNKKAKVGDLIFVSGFSDTGLSSVQYEVLDVTRIGSTTYFQFELNGVEENAVINVAHYDVTGEVRYRLVR